MTAFTTFPFCTWPSGAASFTLAVITSPSPARNPVAPPSGRIICSLRAPELSATSSMLLIITAIIRSPSAPRVSLTHFRGDGFRQQRGPAQDFLQAPALQLGKRPSLFQAHDVAHVSFVLLVVSVELFHFGDHAAVEGMRFLAHNFHHDGLEHAVRDNFANHFLAPSLFHDLALLCICVGHDYFFSVVPPASSRSRAMVFTRAMSLRRPRIFFRLSVCPMLSWNFSLKSWSLSSRSW